MAADGWKMYDHSKEFIGDGTIDLDAGDAYFSVVLLDSGYTASLAHETYADISGDELSTANGYTVGGDICSSTTWTESSGTITFDADDPAWTASGGSITARFAVLVHIAAGSSVPLSTDKLIAYSLLDNTPADVTATDGQTFTLTLTSNGFFTMSGGNT